MRVYLFACLLLIPSAPVTAQLGKALGDESQLRGIGAGSSQVASGLKEALLLGTANAVKLAATENGFYADDSIKIHVPDKMRALEHGLRLMGQGLRINELELSMNRAAEAAAPAAAPLFAKAISDLNFADARAILNGPNNAASEYLAHTTSADLSRALRPAVEAAMSRTNVVPEYNYLATQMTGLTLGQSVSINITDYVVNRTLSGLFVLLSRQEENVRNNPEAQASPLLKEVFAKSPNPIAGK